LGSLDFNSGWTNVSSNMTINSATNITAGATNSLILKNYGALTAGKNYRVRIAGTIDSGVLKVQDVNGSATILTTTSSTFDESVEFTYPSGSTNRQPIAILIATNGATANITHFSYTQIGAVAEYDGSGIASDKWHDKSGNDLHGTVDDASIENAPTGDDGLVYEEGTWDAGITFASGSATLSTSFDTGKYIRIGNVVHVQGFFALASISSPSGDTFITGLPFTNPDHTEGQEFSAVSIRMTDLASALNGSPQGFVSSNATTIFLEKFVEDGTNAGTSRELGTHISATTTILLSATYQI